MFKWLLPMLVLAACAIDPRMQTLQDEARRLQAEFQSGKIDEQHAKKRLDARTAQLFGAGRDFCSVYYPRFEGAAAPYGYWYGMGPFLYRYRAFPGCLIEEIRYPPNRYFRGAIPDPRCLSPSLKCAPGGIG